MIYYLQWPSEFVQSHHVKRNSIYQDNALLGVRKRLVHDRTRTGVSRLLVASTGYLQRETGSATDHT